MTIDEQFEKLENTVREYNPGADFKRIRESYEFAKQHHGEQRRKSGELYITHPLAVAQIVAEELHLDSESIEAALLHDTIEDTSAHGGGSGGGRQQADPDPVRHQGR